MWTRLYYEHFEDITVVMRSRKSKKVIHNGQKQKE